VERVGKDILRFRDGELIYQQGDVGNVMYVIRSGHAKMLREDSHGQILLAELGPADFFGEMSLLSGGRRSATALADGITECEVITRSVFLEHVQDPLARRVLEGLTDRLRKVDTLLEFLHVEQFRIRQDAHDRVYNRLAALSKLVEVAGLTYDPEDGGDEEMHPEDSLSLRVIAADIRETVSELQCILGDRSSVDPSPQVEHEELVSRLHGVCSSQGDIWRMGVDLECQRELPPLPQAMCWDMECIVEEALTNAAKHGQAETVRVTLDVEHDDVGDPLHVVLSITDDGMGLVRVPDLSELPQRSKGLRGMHSRVQSYGGRIDLDSAAQGTMLSVLLPVQAV
jgi:signal transduction histidine kinase